jgi:hypothetical protein
MLSTGVDSAAGDIPGTPRGRRPDVLWKENGKNIFSYRTGHSGQV